MQQRTPVELEPEPSSALDASSVCQREKHQSSCNQRPHKTAKKKKKSLKKASTLSHQHEEESRRGQHVILRSQARACTKVNFNTYQFSYILEAMASYHSTCIQVSTYYHPM